MEILVEIFDQVNNARGCTDKKTLRNAYPVKEKYYMIETILLYRTYFP
jgi:hypothetical protein